jgi:UDP-2,4-diacetamido-2,4,6-trideoxy-beta-L-altropyranose hydrolase
MPMELKRDLPPLLVRADADETRGTGHVMRSLALVHGWISRGGRVRFLSSCPNPTLRRRIQAAGAVVTEIGGYHPDAADLHATVAVVKETVSALKQLPWVVADGYHFDTAYQNALRAAGCRLLVIDDNAHLPFYDADVVLNHGIHAFKLTYSCPLDTKLLLGTAYALLRPEFRQSAAVARSIPPIARKILVTLGGSDPGNATQKVIEALHQVKTSGLEVKIVVGPVNPHLQTLKRLVAESMGAITLETAVHDMASLMRWADVAVAAAGGTCWELACLGVPMVNIVVADNQKVIAAELEAAGVSVNLGWYHEVAASHIAAVLSEILRAPHRRAQMSIRGKTMVDGQGVSRVIDAMLEKSFLRAA